MKLLEGMSIIEAILFSCEIVAVFAGFMGKSFFAAFSSLSLQA
jgi:hypothetical protein